MSLGTSKSDRLLSETGNAAALAQIAYVVINCWGVKCDRYSPLANARLAN